MVCFHAAPAQGQVWPYPQQPVKIRNYRAVASHNQTAISYLYLLRKLVTFSGLPHFKNDSQFVVTQTHHPIPALAHKECGEKASRDGQVVQDGLGAGGAVSPTATPICPNRNVAATFAIGAWTRGPICCSFTKGIFPFLSFVSSSHNTYEVSERSPFSNHENEQEKKTLLIRSH